ADLGKVVKPHLDLRRVAGNRNFQPFRGMCSYDASSADLLHQAAVDQFAAGMEPARPSMSQNSAPRQLRRQPVRRSGANSMATLPLAGFHLGGFASSLAKIAAPPG